jgi:molybdate transport system substrate-binding protein
MRRQFLARWIFAAGIATLLMVGAAAAADIHVMISAGFYNAYSELGPIFERASGHRLVTTRGPSMGDSPESIPARLARSEAADVVILDGGAADELGRRGLVRADSKIEFARSLIGMVVRAGAAKPDIASLEALRSTLLATKSIRTRTAAAANIYRSRCSPSSASRTKSPARAERCADLPPASRWPRLSRVARRRSASSRLAN